LALAQAFVRAGRFGEAARVLPDPAILRPEPYAQGGRRTALALRGLIAASEGRLKDAARDLAAGDGRTEAAEEVARRLAVIGDPPGATIRFLRGLLPRDGEVLGRSVFWVADGEVRRLDVPENRRAVIGRPPAAARALKAVGTDTVVVAGRDRVWRLDAGRPSPTWTEVLPTKGEGGPMAIDATAEITAALPDGFLNVWSTADPARGRWSAGNVRHFRILGGDLLVVTVEGGRRWYLKRLDGWSGTTRWRASLGEGAVDLLAHDGSLAVLWDSQSGLTAWEVESGRRRWVRKLEPVNSGRAINNLAEILVAGTRVYVRAAGTLYGLSAEDGRTEWTLPFVQRPDETPDSNAGTSAGALRRRPDGSVWWFAELLTPAAQTAVRLVTPDGQVKLVPPSPGDRLARLTFLDDGSFLMPPRYGNWVEWWAPR
jgi:hypothetical protein